MRTSTSALNGALRRLSGLATFFAATLFLAACGDKEAGAAYLDKLSEGISRDSLFTLLGDGPLTAAGADTVRIDKGWRISRFLIDGTVYEVVYVRDEPGNVSEPLARKLESPIVLDGGKVRGWGWEWYMEKGIPSYRLPSAPVDSADAKS